MGAMVEQGAPRSHGLYVLPAQDRRGLLGSKIRVCIFGIKCFR